MDGMNTLLSVPAVLAIVELAKRFGLNGPWSMLAAVVVAIAINIGDYYLGTAGAWQAATQGLLLGLAAAGLYDVAKTAAPKAAGAETPPEVDDAYEVGSTD